MKTVMAPLSKLNELEKKMAILESKYVSIYKKTETLLSPSNPIFEVETRLRIQIQGFLASNKAAMIDQKIKFDTLKA